MRHHCVYIAAVALLAGAAVAMPSLGLAATPQALTPPEARSLFSACGYAVSNSASSVGTAYLVVGDPQMNLAQDDQLTDDRIVMAIVYRDLQAATRAHQQAHSLAEQVMGSRWDWSDDNGPQLLDGYGGSVWRANVAIVQSDKRTLDSMYTSDSETGETAVARPELLALGFVTSSTKYAVDFDFVRCLENGVSAAADTPATPSETDARPSQFTPDFLPGHPW
jgi:hypothetical protein